MDANEIQNKMIRHLQRKIGNFVIPNVTLLGSTWESDVVLVTKSLFWTEFEIKTSVADYRKDFLKSERRWKSGSLLKHDAYSSAEPILSSRQWTKREFIPKPKQFYFVTPVRLLNVEDIPAHCGLIEFDEDHNRPIYQRVAPRLKKPTKIDTETLFNLALKASKKR